MKSLKKLVILIIILVEVSALTLGQQYPGTNLRGKVVRINNSVVASARVDLLSFDSRSRQWRIIKTTSTDQTGFYYFKYIVPNKYTIKINSNTSHPIQVKSIDYRYYTYQDLPVITIK